MIRALRIAGLIAAALLAGCRAEPASNAVEPPAPRTSPAGLDLVALTVESGGRRHGFTVEVARTPDQQARGLMGRRSLAADAGMLFPYDPPQPASFWMRNTLIPLDMIFIRADGSIARIAANTVPLSETPVTVAEPVTAVLELRGGRAAELGIRAGDRVSWSD
ncbi:MAG TPA: DUF192 domain-containing protein [Allosphingosinicella sp.]|nr:DUF192 domain-containing protein [Allosphingosinicella sp.]